MKKIYTPITLFIFALHLTSWAQAVECPLGASEDHLTIHRVMLNFGKFTREAGMIAVNGPQEPAKITDADFTKAMSDLVIAAACAEAVLQNPTGDLLPAKASQLQDEEQTKYIQGFLAVMSEFKASLETLRLTLRTVQQQPSDQKDFQLVVTKNKEMKDIASYAHNNF